MSRKPSKDFRFWLRASGVTAEGKRRNFEIERKGQTFRIIDTETLNSWQSNSYQRATEEEVSRDLEVYFKLSDVTIHEVTAGGYATDFNGAPGAT
ncbi:MAG: hypothetical protein WAM44_04785 [Chthoniobacterales bacterium]